MAGKVQQPERKVYVTIRSPAGKKEKLETWRYWEIVGALQWMGADRQTAYDTAMQIYKLPVGARKALKQCDISIEITEATEK